MERLQQLSRRQLDALRSIGRAEGGGAGVPLKLVAASLRVRPPSALEHLTALESFGLVARHRGKTRLTAQGRGTLLEYQRHHRLAESLFHGLGLPREQVCAAASEIDLAISHRTVERLCAAAGHPTVCPHGEPIAPCTARGTAR